MRFIPVIIVSLLFLLPLTVSAAVFLIEPSAATLHPGALVSVTIALDTENESINAVEGTLLVPPTFEITDVRDGNSIVSFWLERPRPDSLRFSGVIPGGYHGPHGELFTLSLRAKG